MNDTSQIFLNFLQFFKVSRWRACQDAAVVNEIRGNDSLSQDCNWQRCKIIADSDKFLDVKGAQMKSFVLLNVDS